MCVCVCMWVMSDAWYVCDIIIGIEGHNYIKQGPNIEKCFMVAHGSK